VLLAYGLGLMIGEGALQTKLTAAPVEGTKKGGGRRPEEVEALLGAIRAAKEAALRFEADRW
jgi:hypothetical protein